MENKIETKDFYIENLYPQLATLSLKNPILTDDDMANAGTESNHFILDFGERKKGDNVECDFILKSKDFKITSVGASCGCTRPTFTNTEDPEVQGFKISFDSSKITTNVSKWSTLYLNNNAKILKINVIINKL